MRTRLDSGTARGLTCHLRTHTRTHVRTSSAERQPPHVPCPMSGGGGVGEGKGHFLREHSLRRGVHARTSQPASAECQSATIRTYVPVCSVCTYSAPRYRLCEGGPPARRALSHGRSAPRGEPQPSITRMVAGGRALEDASGRGRVVDTHSKPGAAAGQVSRSRPARREKGPSAQATDGGFDFFQKASISRLARQGRAGPVTPSYLVDGGNP